MKKSDQLSNKDVKTEHFKIAKPYAHLTLLPSSLQLSSSFFDMAFQMRSGSSLWPLHSSLPAVCCSHCFLWCDALLFSSFPHSNPLFKDQCFNPTHNMKNLANYSSLHLFASSCQLLQDILQIPKCSHVLVLFGFCGEQKAPRRLPLFWVLPFLGGDGGWAGLSNRWGI